MSTGRWGNVTRTQNTPLWSLVAALSVNQAKKTDLNVVDINKAPRRPPDIPTKYCNECIVGSVDLIQYETHQSSIFIRTLI